MNSRVVSFRLHPGDEYEAKALEILDYWLNEGVNVRHLLTDALLRLDGQTPEMFNDDEQALTRGILSATLDRKLSAMQQDIIEYLQNQNTGGGQVRVAHDPPPTQNDSDGLSKAERNLIVGFNKRRNK